MADQATTSPAIGSPPGVHSSRVAAIQALLQQWTPLPHSTKSPEEEFQEKYKEAQARFDTATALTRGHSEDPASYTAKVDHVVSCGIRLNELVAEHKAHKDDKERKYQQLFLSQQVALIFGLLDTFGPELGKALYKTWRMRGQRPLNNPTQPNTIAGSAAEVTANSSFTTNTSPVSQPLHPQNATNETAPVLPVAESSRVQEARTTGQSSEKAQQPSQAQQKRPASPPHANLSHLAKRSRPNIPQPPKSLTGDRSIDFADVYQDGNAETKYMITFHKDSWYILECKKCKLHFRTINPVKGARKHLTSGAHGHLQPNHDQTIGMLGTRVRDCTKELADLNNDVTQRPSYEALGRPSSVLSTESTSSSREHPRTRSTQVIPGLDPKPGEIYTAFWPKTKQFYAILVLTWGSFRQFGWEMTLKSCSDILDRDRDIPSCYDYDRDTESVEWTENYKPGGRYYHKRKYPVLYFDAADVPGKCLVGWVGVNEFRYYDPHDAEIPFKDKVDDFIQRMGERNLSGDVEMDAQATDSASGNASDQQQNTGADQPRLGASMRTAIYVSDGDDSDHDEDETEARPSTVRQQPKEPRVKTEPTNEEAPTQPSDAATAQTTTNSVGSESANQWNGLDHTPTVPNPGSRVDANGMLNTAVPNTSAVEDSSISSSHAPPRPGRQICDELPTPCWSGPQPREHQIAPIEDTGPRAPEAVMAPGDPPTANGPAPFARMSNHAALENSAPLDLYGYLSPEFAANTTADAAGNGGLIWMTPRTATEVARDRETDIRNAAARRTNWRQPFVSDDTD
ncbi:hypothetical protein BFJ66_g13994 [Fusarium oxysporum f. sp. cepae]|uniref:Uncharacterized protein n=1 Tax=Fusarium oxysporum f. sp. cepae TaxID=396571 RepID=A0A3L6NFU3_FUSOX|nr:hypothetical protein BFJ65_g9636 [Fusarium oxysporum f. sp. cepae]RKK33883.1 hypothetical protein BFJ67_g14052 [Fusarium oxysporum f. sp. cepae]RKK35381.1 hypothetical protein BFJ66_g13994 [Fusarium oxysporum f. sp. cepae]